MAQRYEGPPMSLENMRSLGVRNVYLDCECGHVASVNVDALSDDVYVPDVKLHGRCSKCGAALYSRAQTGRFTGRQAAAPFKLNRMPSLSCKILMVWPIIEIERADGERAGVMETWRDVFGLTGQDVDFETVHDIYRARSMQLPAPVTMREMNRLNWALEEARKELGTGRPVKRE